MPDNLDNPLTVQNDSSLMSSVTRSTHSMLGNVLDDHYRMLIKTAPEAAGARPVFYIKFSSSSPDSANTSKSALSSIASERYRLLDEQLDEFEARNQVVQTVEPGALVTTRDVLRQLQILVFAPPQLTSFGDEAFLLAWKLVETSFIMTITEGEAGYVVRQQRRTIKKRSDIKIDRHHLLRIE